MLKALVLSVAILGIAAPAAAAPCRDARGKFIKCPTTTVVKVKRCKDVKGRFSKCTTTVKPAA